MRLVERDLPAHPRRPVMMEPRVQHPWLVGLGLLLMLISAVAGATDTVDLQQEVERAQLGVEVHASAD